eukprot:13931974-Alexandrium_andersonii.AAC.1
MSAKHTVGSKSSVVYSGLVAFAGVNSATKGDKKKKARRRAAATDGDRDDEVLLAQFVRRVIAEAHPDLKSR